MTLCITVAKVQRHVAVLDLSDGRSMVVPLPEMVRVAPKQLRRRWVVIDGACIHWPGIGEDLVLDEVLETPPMSTIRRPTYTMVRNAMGRAACLAEEDLRASERSARSAPLDTPLRIPDLFCAWHRQRRMYADFQALAATKLKHLRGSRPPTWKVQMRGYKG